MALCIGFDRKEEQRLTRPAVALPQTPVQEFAKAQIGNIKTANYYRFEDDLDLFLVNGDYSWDEVHQAILEEAISISDFDSIEYLLRRMNKVKFLNELDIDRKGGWPVPNSETVYNHFWGSLDTPFISNDQEIMEYMMKYYDKRDDSQSHVMWSDGKKICMKIVSLDEAAMASANHEMYELVDSMKGGWGWIDQECVYLSDDEDLVQKYSGQRITLDMDSDALYWMSEGPSLIVAGKTDSDVSSYDIRKILRAANPVFLGKYLMAYPDIDNSVIESWKAELRSGNNMKLTVEMFRDLCDSHDCYCMPYNRDWMEDRVTACCRLLKEYEAGVRFFYEEEEEDEYNGWNEWDEWDE